MEHGQDPVGGNYTMMSYESGLMHKHKYRHKLVRMGGLTWVERRVPALVKLLI